MSLELLFCHDTITVPPPERWIAHHAIFPGFDCAVAASTRGKSSDQQMINWLQLGMPRSLRRATRINLMLSRGRPATITVSSRRTPVCLRHSRLLSVEDPQGQTVSVGWIRLASSPLPLQRSISVFRMSPSCLFLLQSTSLLLLLHLQHFAISVTRIKRLLRLSRSS